MRVYIDIYEYSSSSSWTSLALHKFAIKPNPFSFQWSCRIVSPVVQESIFRRPDQERRSGDSRLLSTATLPHQFHIDPDRTQSRFTIVHHHYYHFFGLDFISPKFPRHSSAAFADCSWTWSLDAFAPLPNSLRLVAGFESSWVFRNLADLIRFRPQKMVFLKVFHAHVSSCFFFFFHGRTPSRNLDGNTLFFFSKKNTWQKREICFFWFTFFLYICIYIYTPVHHLFFSSCDLFRLPTS